MSLDTILATPTHRPDINEGAGRWASERIFGKPDGFAGYSTLTVLRNSQPIAVVVFHNWQQDAGVIELSAAGGSGWQSRRVINEVMSICFDAMECQMVVMRNSANDDATVSNSRRLGFTGTLLPRLRGRDEDEWLFTLTEEAWRSGRLYKA